MGLSVKLYPNKYNLLFQVTDIGGYACHGTNNIDTRSESINLIVVAACEVREI